MAKRVQRPRFRSSLRWRLSLAISGLVLLCSILCVVGAFLFLRQALTDRATADLQRDLSSVSGYLDNQHSDVFGAATLVASDPTVARAARTSDKQTLIVHLKPLFADLNVDIIDVIDTEGRVIVRIENTSLPSGDSVLDRPSVLAALQGNPAVAVESDLPGKEAAGGYALRAAMPIRINGTTIVGAVIVGRQLGGIFASRVSRAVNADVNVIAGNQRTGTTLTDSNGFPATGLPEPQSVLQRITTGRQSIAQISEDGQTVLSGVVPLQGFDGHWVGAVEVVRPLGPLYDVVKRLSFLLIALGSLVVILGTLLALYVSRRVTNRLRILEAAASQVAAAATADEPLPDLQTVDTVQGNDEVASLAESFGAMMGALDERIAANAALYAAAQSRVRELSGLAEIARLLTSVESVRDTMHQLGEHVCRLVGSSAVAIWLPGQGPLPALFGGHGLPEDYERITNDVMQLMVQGTSITAAEASLLSGQVEYRDIGAALGDSAPPSVLELRQALHSCNLYGATAVPLRLQDRIVGAMTCYTTVAAPLSSSDLGLLTTIADQVAVAVENARLYERSRDVGALEERQRLARELHDSVSQALYGIALGAQTARSLLDHDPKKADEPLQYVLTQAEAGLTEMRALIYELRPEALETEGLVGVLEQQVAAVRARHGLTVEAHMDEEPDVPLPIKEAVYRIAQEALHNAVRHASARGVRLTLEWDGDEITLEVEDNGKGFHPDDDFTGHYGLTTMRERAARFGGTLEITSAPGDGTQICAHIPTIQRHSSLQQYAV